MDHTQGEWSFKQFKSPVVKFSIVIQSTNGDTICKMMRSDNPSDIIQESNAKLIASAPELLKMLMKWIELFEESDMKPEDECNELYHESLEIIKKATE